MGGGGGEQQHDGGARGAPRQAVEDPRRADAGDEDHGVEESQQIPRGLVGDEGEGGGQAEGVGGEGGGEGGVDGRGEAAEGGGGEAGGGECEDQRLAPPRAGGVPGVEQQLEVVMPRVAVVGGAAAAAGAVEVVGEGEQRV